MRAPQPHDPERSAFIALLKDSGISPQRRLGQVFLFRQSVADEIVGLALITSGDVVVEIGPGLGILTHPLARTGARIIGLEFDSRLAAYLQGAMRYPNVEIIRADALHYDYRELQQLSQAPLIIVGNLPYYLTSPLIFSLIRLRPLIGRMVLMIQHEVAERVSSPPDTYGYGIISVLSQMFFDVDRRLTVLKDCFYPMPAVDSEVVVFATRDRPLAEVSDDRLFTTLVQVCFAHPRKTLLNGLKACNYFERGKEGIVESLRACGIDPMRRAHTLSIDDYARLANAIFPGQAACR
jgi:16S rRNA (adenine1518-N6/adenine1519-N6)-dimethyltransferase